MPDAQHTPETQTPPLPAANKTSKRTRHILFVGLAAACLLGVAGYGIQYALVASHLVETDNAYVGANTAQITPLVSGPVRSVEANDTQAVTQGQVLVVLDDTDARIALASAQAQLVSAQRKIRAYIATDQSLSAQIGARTADEDRAAAALTSAQADFDRARIDLERRKALIATGAASGDELTRAQNAFTNAQAAVMSAKAAQVQASANHTAAVSSLAANAALTDGLSIDENPEVAMARARVDQAMVDLARTVIRAPIDGVVVRRNVQVGQKVAPGSVLMQVVPVQQAYVDANFKEGQLKKVRVGQAVELESDLYGETIKFHGTVVGLSGGTGSAFSLIPAQNATGNWIKVVQRLPVRIAIDPADLKAHPLRVGLTMKAIIDTSNTSSASQKDARHG